MFWIGLFIGFILGANISLILYAIILLGKQSDRKNEYMYDYDDDIDEMRWSYDFIKSAI